MFVVWQCSLIVCSVGAVVVVVAVALFVAVLVALDAAPPVGLGLLSLCSSCCCCGGCCCPVFFPVTLCLGEDFLLAFVRPCRSMGTVFSVGVLLRKRNLFLFVSSVCSLGSVDTGSGLVLFLLRSCCLLLLSLCDILLPCPLWSPSVDMSSSSDGGLGGIVLSRKSWLSAVGGGAGGSSPSILNWGRISRCTSLTSDDWLLLSESLE